MEGFDSGNEQILLIGSCSNVGLKISPIDLALLNEMLFFYIMQGQLIDHKNWMKQHEGDSPRDFIFLYLRQVHLQKIYCCG